MKKFYQNNDSTMNWTRKYENGWITIISSKKLFISHKFSKLTLWLFKKKIQKYINVLSSIWKQPEGCGCGYCAECARSRIKTRYSLWYTQCTLHTHTTENPMWFSAHWMSSKWKFCSNINRQRFGVSHENRVQLKDGNAAFSPEHTVQPTVVDIFFSSAKLSFATHPIRKTL